MVKGLSLSVKALAAKISHFFGVTVLGAITICLEIMPHTAGFSPLIAFSVALPRLMTNSKQSLFLIISVFIFICGLESRFFHYPFLGSWFFFMLTGLVGVWLLSIYYRKTFFKWWSLALIAPVVYWLWTNLGTWLCTDMYPASLQGLSLCYLAALPFLGTSLLGSVSFLFFYIGVCKGLNGRFIASLLPKAFKYQEPTSV